MAELRALPQEFSRGVKQHQRIDAFTDAHPVVRRSLKRFPAPHRRFAGILMDVYYDHFLSRDWPHYSPVPLRKFIDDFFEGLEAHRAELPPLACTRLDQIRRAGWLCSYGEWDGLADVLRRMGARLRRPCDLSASLTIFKAHYDEFHGDFREFFPQLQAAVNSSQSLNPQLQNSQLPHSGNFAASTSPASI